MSKINALEELTKGIGAGVIIAAKLLFDFNTGSHVLETRVTLNSDFDATQYLAFLEAINVTYDNGWGGQELHGTVWLADGTWLERREYDGSEWWHHAVRPSLPRGVGLELTYDPEL